MALQEKASRMGSRELGPRHALGLALFHRFPLDALPQRVLGRTKLRSFEGHGVLLGLHVCRPSLPRASKARGLVGVRHVFSWRFAVDSDDGATWRALRTVASVALWRRFLPAESMTRAHFRFRSDATSLALEITSGESCELEVGARFDGTSPRSVLGHPRYVESELFGEARGCHGLIRGPLALEPMRFVDASTPFIRLPVSKAFEAPEQVVRDSVYRIVDRRSAGQIRQRDLSREARTTPVVFTPS